MFNRFIATSNVAHWLCHWNLHFYLFFTSPWAMQAAAPRH